MCFINVDDSDEEERPDTAPAASNAHYSSVRQPCFCLSFSHRPPRIAHGCICAATHLQKRAASTGDAKRVLAVGAGFAREGPGPRRWS